MLKVNVSEINARKDNSCKQAYPAGMVGQSISGSYISAPPPSNVYLNLSGYLMDSENLADALNADDLVILTKEEYESLLGKKIVE